MQRFEITFETRNLDMRMVSEEPLNDPNQEKPVDYQNYIEEMKELVKQKKTVEKELKRQTTQ